MEWKVLTILTILCLHTTTCSWGFVLKRAHDNNHGANKLAEALKVIQTQKRNLADQNDNQGSFKDAEDLYGQSDWGYPWGKSSDEGVSQFGPQRYGSQDVVNKPELEEEDYYNDYASAEADALAKLLEYYYTDLGGESKPVPQQEDNSIKEADNQEIEQLLDTKEEEKKNIDWTPKALGFEGLKHKRTEEDSVVGEDPVVVEGGEEQPKAIETNLSDDEVNQLLQDAKDTEVKAISKDIEVENINGKETVSADEIVDLLKDDGTGHKKEFIIENKVPIQTNDKQQLNKELVVQEVPAETELSLKQKRGGDMLPSAPLGDDLVRECLMKYIELEDQENTALAEALNWATKAQYDQTDAYIPMQVQYLRNAVRNEEVLVELRRRCFGLAEDEDQSRDIQEADDISKRAYDTEEQPLVGTEDDDEYIDELQPTEKEGQFLEDIPDEESIYEELSRQEIADFIADELQRILLDQEAGQWMDNAIPEEQPDKDYYINPFLRELLYKYRRGKLQLDKRSEEGNEDICPAIKSQVSCEEELGLEMDEDAEDLCNRHRVCYQCGASFHVRPTTCDKGFLGEAYQLCEKEDDEAACVQEADQLFEAMFSAHDYTMEALPHCANTCVLDFITGDITK